MSDQTQGDIHAGEETRPAPIKSFSLLAKEMYGDKYYGEVNEEAPEKQSLVQESDTGGQTQDVDDVDTLSEDVVGDEDSHESDDLAAEDTTEAEGTEDSGEGPTISSLRELIEHEGWDPEWVQNLKVPVKVDGVETEAPLAELVKSYQIGEAAEKRLEEAKSKAKSITQELAAQNEALQAQFAIASKLIETTEEVLNEQVKNIDWNALREEDPAEYAAKKADVAERRKTIEQLKRDAVAEYQQAVQQALVVSQEKQLEAIRQEQEKLLEALPEWRDPQKAAEEKRQMVKYLSGMGFTEEDIAAASDHRLILLAHKAMLYDRSQQKVSVAKKKVRKAPKVLKPGAAKTKEQSAEAERKKALARLRETGSLEDAYQAILAKRR